jgi:hypothetical protein
MAVLIVLGVATVAPPLRCLYGDAGIGACFAKADTFLANPTWPTGTGGAVAVAPDAGGAGQPAAAAASSPPAEGKTVRGLVAATFDLLQPAAAGATGLAAAASHQAPSTTPKATPDGGLTVMPATHAGGPTTRRVTTIAIRPGATQGLGIAPTAAAPQPVPLAPQAAAPAVPQAAAPQVAAVPAAEAAPVVAAQPEVATAPGTAPDGSAPWPLVRPDRAISPAAAAAAPASGTVHVVGSGANVRAGPSRSRDRLFALAPGQEVKVTDSQRGWRKITDSRGRSGWIYSDYLAGGGK